jgi:hypothetical protein
VKPEAVAPLLASAVELRSCSRFSGTIDRKTTGDVVSGATNINMILLTTYGIALSKAAEVAIKDSHPEDALAASDALLLLGYYVGRDAEDFKAAISLRQSLDVHALEIRERLSESGALKDPASHWRELSSQVQQEWRAQHDALMKQEQKR